MKKKGFNNCFIIASADTKILPLKRLLKERNIIVHDFFSSRSLGLSISSLITKEIKNADFIIAILDLKTSQPNVFFELGLAQGIGKPVFLIIQDEGHIPADLRDMVHVRLSSDDWQSIAFALDHFLSKYEYRPTKTVFRSKAYKKTKLASDIRQENLVTVQKHGTSKELAALFVKLLKSEKIIFQYQFETNGADMALWIDSLEASLGNPILVEFKIGNLSNSILMKAEQQLRHYVKKTATRTGLLIYLDRRGRQFKPSRFELPLIIRLDARDLVTKLSDKPLHEIILSERNRLAHFGE
jgi:nucleoside 2-deoxyribosyltransferase